MKFTVLMIFATLFGAFAWGAQQGSDPGEPPTEIQSALGVTTASSDCPCRYLSGDKRLEGDTQFTVEQSEQNDGTANSVK